MISKVIDKLSCIDSVVADIFCLVVNFFRMSLKTVDEFLEIIIDTDAIRRQVR